MAAPILLPLLIGAVVIAVLAGKKSKPSSGATTGGNADENADENLDVPPPITDGDVAGCLDPGLLASNGPLAAQIAAALQNPAALGVDALLALAAAAGSAAGPVAQACLKEAADKLKPLPGGGSPPSTIPSGGSPPFLTEIGGALGKIGEALGVPPGGIGGGGGPMPMMLPTYPSGASFALIGQEPPGSPQPPFLLPLPPGINNWDGAVFTVRARDGLVDTPGSLAQWYTGKKGRFTELQVLGSTESAAAGPLNEGGGPKWKVGEQFVMPAEWQPYSQPMPAPGTSHFDSFENYPPRPPVPFVPGV